MAMFGSPQQKRHVCMYVLSCERICLLGACASFHYNVHSRLPTLVLCLQAKATNLRTTVQGINFQTGKKQWADPRQILIKANTYYCFNLYGPRGRLKKISRSGIWNIILQLSAFKLGLIRSYEGFQIFNTLVDRIKYHFLYLFHQKTQSNSEELN